MSQISADISSDSPGSQGIQECFELARKPCEERGPHAEPNWAPAGPGWFESSWLLRRGLEVREIEFFDLLESV